MEAGQPEAVHLRPAPSCLGVACVLAALALACPGASGAVLYELSHTALDGSAGENTYIVENSQTASGLAYDSGAPSLTWTLGSSSNYTYFLGYFDSFTLTNVGDSIRLDYMFTRSSANTFSNSHQALRLGLFDSGNARITGDIPSSVGSTSFYGYTGYMGLYAPAVTPNSTDTLVQRNDDPDSAVLLSTSPATAIPGSPTLDSPNTTTVDGTLSLTLMATGVQIASTINGNTTQSVLDTTSPYLTFDTFGFLGFAGTNNPTLTFTELTVTSVAPEPNALTLMIVGVVLIGVRPRVVRGSSRGHG